MIARLPGLREAVFSLIRSGLWWYGASVAGEAQAQEHTAVEKTLEFFHAIDPLSFESVLERVWTPPASTDEVKAGLVSFENSVPEGGEVKRLERRDRQKIAASRAVLAAFKRPLLEIKIIDVPQAYMGLYKRSIILGSLPALQLLNLNEMRGIVAHEAAHDLVWTKWESARAANNRRFLHELELFCDGLAIVVLHSLRTDLAIWMSGLEKLLTYNRRRFGRAAHDGRYPFLSERRKFAETITRRLGEPDAWSLRERR